MCECFCYHDSRHITTPRSSDANIKGIELEISDYDSRRKLNDLIDEGILTTPYNEGCSNDNIAVEEDGSVYRELIFKACSNRTILERLKPLEEELGDIHNGHGTSCHIHLNNRYLRNENIKKLELAKATEFLYPILYKISGRSMDSLRWCRSFTGFSANEYNLYKRCQQIDNMSYDYLGDRYKVLNVSRDSTTELRIFSNYFNFDSEYIKMYLETADFIMELAKEMDDKSYESNFDIAMDKAKEFFSKRKYKKIAEKHNLEIFFASAEEQKALAIKEKVQELINRYESFKENEFNNELHKVMSFIRIIRDFNKRGSNEISFNITDVDYDKVFNLLKENYIENLEENLNL